MREVNLAGIDLNLLPALEALIRRRNVTRAGEDVGLSQPAMSRALARLRVLLGDPILVKGPRGLTPSARAKAVAAQLASALDNLGLVVRPAAFAADTLDRQFRLAASDVHSLLIGPPLLRNLRAQAPRASMRFLPITSDLHERVQAGDIDLAFALASIPLPPGAQSEPLVEDTLALVARRGDRPGERPWTLTEYAARDHATVSIFGDPSSDIDAELAQAGLTRRIVFTSPHFLAALAAVAASDCVTTVSAALARRFADHFGLQLYDPPLRAKSLPLSTVVSATMARDPAIVWLRAQLKVAAIEGFGQA
ncbi:MAG: LysR family transcriptional regulator [Hyphomicrobiales bacterium]|nr:LysR family transcriptional regulator [Hyphomicrobiales bacterium]